ncbi:MAG: mechanosensitive ion channel [Myxococcales bacterium]|nr:mechanosensitive ion channel [Myxococcales bacterium]
MDLPTTIEDILLSPTAIKLTTLLVGFVVIYLARRGLKRTLSHRLSDTTTRYRTRKLVELASYVVLMLFVAVVFDDQLGGLTVAFGVAGAGVAFALQEVIASIAGWLAIGFTGFYKIGDRVMLGGIKGDVIDIGVLRTTVFELGDWVDGDLYNGRVVRLANSFVFKEPVYNYSADFPFLWDEIRIPVRHGSDRALARQICEEVADQTVGDYARQVQSTWDEMARNYVIEHARLEPMVTMVMDENWMTYTVRYVVEFKRRRATKDALFCALLDRFDASGGRVGVASAAQEITLMRASRVSVELGPSGDQAGAAAPAPR